MTHECLTCGYTWFDNLPAGWCDECGEDDNIADTFDEAAHDLWRDDDDGPSPNCE